VSQTIKLFVSLPLSVRLDGIFKPQLNERGTASTANLDIAKEKHVLASRPLLIKPKSQYPKTI